MLTGRVPYSAETPLAVVMKHIQDPLPSARKFIPDLPESIELILMKVLAKNPDDRYQSVDEFLRALLVAISTITTDTNISIIPPVVSTKPTFVAKEVFGQVEKEEKSSPSHFIVNIHGNVYGSIGNNSTVTFIQKEFEPIYEAIESSSRDAAEKQDLAAEVDDIKNEVTKGEQANESFLSRRLRNLKKMAPDIAEVALSTLANPAAGVGMIVQKIAKKIKSETK